MEPQNTVVSKRVRIMAHVIEFLLLRELVENNLLCQIW